MENKMSTLTGQILQGIRRVTGVISVSEIQRPVRTRVEVPVTTKGGQQTVATAGTAVALGASTEILAVYIVADRTNTGTIYVSDSSVDSNSFKLESGDAVSISISNLNKIYIDASDNGQSVSYMYVTR